MAPDGARARPALLARRRLLTPVGSRVGLALLAALAGLLAAVWRPTAT
jgi:hypothetical protein